MENINKNRLQFVHCDTIFPNREDAIKYVNGDVITIKRPALYAEPMVLKYGDESNPNILLAIGSVGDGVTQSTTNKVFFIDFAHLEESLDEVIEEAKALREDVDNIKLIMSNIIKSSGLDENGEYISNENDEILKDAVSLYNADELLSNALLAEVERAKSEEARIEAKNTLYVTDTNSVSHKLVKEDSGATLSTDVKLAAQYIYGNNVFNNNLILETENGLWANVEVSDGGNTIVFNINGVVTEIPNVHLESGEYSKEKEALVFKLSDEKEVEVPLEELIEEWGVLSEGEQKSPIVLVKSHKEYEDLEHAEAYQDILSANIRISDDDNNILKVDNAYNLYVTKSTLSYDNSKNILKFNNGLEEQTLELNSGAILEQAYYDNVTNELVLGFKLENGQTETVRIDVSSFTVGIRPENNGNVKLTSVYNSKENVHVISADVNISNKSDNILKSDGNSLYVQGISSNISHGNSNVFDELESLKAQNVALESEVNEEFIKLNNSDSELKTLVQNEIDRAEAKENEIVSLVSKNETAISDEIARSTNADNENSILINQLSEKVASIDTAYQKEDTEIRTHIDKLENDLKESESEIKEYVKERIDNITYKVESTNTVELSSTDNVIKANVKVDTTQANVIRANENGLYANVYFDFNESTHELTLVVNDETKVIDVSPFQFIEEISTNNDGDLVIKYVTKDGKSEETIVEINDAINEKIEKNTEDVLNLTNRVSKNENDITLLNNKVSENETNISTLQSESANLSSRVLTNENNITLLSNKVSENETNISTLKVEQTNLSNRVLTNENSINTLKDELEKSKVSVVDTQSVDLELSSTNEIKANVKLNNSDANILKLSDSGLMANVTLSYNPISGELYFNNGLVEENYKIVAQSLVYGVKYNENNELILQIRYADGTEDEVKVTIDKLEGGNNGDSPVTIRIDETIPGTKKITATLNVSSDERNLLSSSSDGSLFASKLASEHFGTYRDTEMTMQEALGRIAEEIDECNYTEEINALNARVASVEADNININNRIDVLYDKVDTIEDHESRINDLEAENLELSNKVSNLELLLNDLQKSLTELQTKYDNLVDFNTY